MFLAMVDQTIVAAALPAIAAELGDVDRISWIVIAYLVATTIAAPVYGRLGDHLGRKRLMMAALVLFILASAACAAATSVEMLAVARVLQGAGGGGLMTLSQALIGESVPPRERARYQGFLATVGVASSAFGAVAGGLLTQYFGWRSIFLVPLPVGLLALVLVRRLPVRPLVQSAPFRFDGLGLFLFAAFIASTLVMLYELQQLQPGSTPLLLMLLGGSVIAVVVLIWWEQRAPDPLLPLSLLRTPAIWRSNALALSHGGMLVSLATFLPIYLRVVHGASPGAIGLLILPIASGVAAGSLITGALITITGRTAIFPSIGLIFVVLILIGTAIFAPSLGMLSISFLLGAAAIFMGTVMGVVQITVQSAAGPARLGTAAASVQFSRSLGAALGTAIVGAVLFSLVSIIDVEAGNRFVDILARGPEALAGLPLARQQAIAAEIGEAFRAAFLTIAVFGLAALGLAWSLPIRRV
jgi:MFS family permease